MPDKEEKRKTSNKITNIFTAFYVFLGNFYTCMQCMVNVFTLPCPLLLIQKPSPQLQSFYPVRHTRMEACRWGREKPQAQKATSYSNLDAHLKMLNRSSKYQLSILNSVKGKKKKTKNKKRREKIKTLLNKQPGGVYSLQTKNKQYSSQWLFREGFRQKRCDSKQILGPKEHNKQWPSRDYRNKF